MRGYRKHMFDLVKIEDVVPRSKEQRIKNCIFPEFQWHGVWCLVNAELHIETVKPLDCTLAIGAYKQAQPQSAIFQHVNQQTYSWTFARVFSLIQFLFSCFQNKGKPDFIVSNFFGLVHHCNAFSFAWPFVINKEINFSSLGDDQPEVPLFLTQRRSFHALQPCANPPALYYLWWNCRKQIYGTTTSTRSTSRSSLSTCQWDIFASRCSTSLRGFWSTLASGRQISPARESQRKRLM